jgi:NADH-quinone oxidoreductase subunit H
VIHSILTSLILFVVLLTGFAYTTVLERRFLAFLQARVGPNRAGPYGLLQPVADGIKLIFKEDITPAHAQKVVFWIAPMVKTVPALIVLAVVPFGPKIAVPWFDGKWYRLSQGLVDVNVGVLWLMGITSIGIYGIVLAGWSSNNKYAMLGGLRSSAQMVSYELPLAMAIVSPLLMANTLNLREIVELQGGFYFGFLPKWNLFAAPVPQVLAFIIFLIAAFAETNRVPFDLPEAESELVAGFHTEYSSMMFASFFMAEYANIITICCVATVLFLGGWHPLWPAEYGSDLVPVVLLAGAGLILLFHAAQAARRRKWDRFTFPVFGVLLLGASPVFLIPMLKPVLIPFFWFVAKAGFLVFVFIWIRGTLPRYRYDQLMRFAWTFLFPLAVANLLITGLVVALAG